LRCGGALWLAEKVAHRAQVENPAAAGRRKDLDVCCDLRNNSAWQIRCFWPALARQGMLSLALHLRNGIIREARETPEESPLSQAGRAFRSILPRRFFVGGRPLETLESLKDRPENVARVNLRPIL
jgi:hypothetical protein